MSKLGQLLSYLERPGVTDLVFRSGAPAAIHSANRLHPLTVAPLQVSQIRRFFEGTAVLERLPKGNDELPARTAAMELLGAIYQVTIGGSASALEVRIGKQAPPHSSTWPDVPTDVPVAREQRVSSSGMRAASPARAGIPVHDHLREILATARQHGVSDVHIVAGNPVRVRRLGALEPVSAPVAPAEVEAMAASLLQPSHTRQLEALGYADLAANVEGAGRVRINVSRQRTGLKLCFRLVVDEPPSVAALGLPPEVHKLTMHHQGLVILSGPNGHGKTTSMAALVDLFNAGYPLHIVTVEDPVEVIHPRKHAIVTQREVGSHTRSFARALAAALREDPDVIAIGELRNRETVEMALLASETGHLVIATMSAPSGAKTIDRMIDMFPPDDQAQVRATLAGALKLVLSQRLLRRADGHGLVAAFEMISGGVPLWSLIRDDKLFQLPSLLQRGRNFGMIGLDDSLRELLGQGVITHEEALVYAKDPFGAA